MTAQSSSISLPETQIWKSELYGQPIRLWKPIVYWWWMK